MGTREGSQDGPLRKNTAKNGCPDVVRHLQKALFVIVPSEEELRRSQQSGFPLQGWFHYSFTGDGKSPRSHGHPVREGDSIWASVAREHIPEDSVICQMGPCSFALIPLSILSLGNKTEKTR